MNWRIIVGLILLIVGIRVFYVVVTAAGSPGGYSKMAGFVWIAVGMFFIIRGMTFKKEQ